MAAAGCDSRQAHDAREAVEARIEAQDALDAVLFHDGGVQSVASRKVPVAEDDHLGAFRRDGRPPNPARRRGVPVFGVLKELRGLRRFRRRGPAKVGIELVLASAAYNLTRLWRKAPDWGGQP